MITSLTITNMRVKGGKIPSYGHRQHIDMLGFEPTTSLGGGGR